MREVDETDARTRIERAARALDASEAWLQRQPPSAIAAGVAGAARALRRDFDSPRSLLQGRLSRQSGLSPAMVTWAATTTLASMDEANLTALAEAHRSAHRTDDTRMPPPYPDRAGTGPCAVFLSGNVCTAAIRAIALPLLAGRTVLAKAASGQDVMAQAFRRALTAQDEALGGCVAVEVFGREDHPATQAMVSAASVISAYGDRDTLAVLSETKPAHVPLIPHGPGTGAIYLPQRSLSDHDARARLLERVALDVAAYDQRGCLSPHHVFVETGTVAPHALAEELSAALATLGTALPRGRADAQLQAQAMQWRGVAATCGELIEGQDHAVAIEATPRTGPGHRHVAIIPCSDRDAAIDRLRSWGDQLKTLGVPGERERDWFSQTLAPQQRPQPADPGQLQTPRCDALCDGRPPMAGL
ncbi:MAG: hypothetical protein OXU20_34065 [Myxococcales bacterium]|nr:hypothetical protein [Myxococcales bacterium]